MIGIIYKEFIRSFKELISYKRIFYTDFIVYSAIFIILIMSGTGSGSVDYLSFKVSSKDAGAVVLISYIYWTTINASLVSISGSIINDSKTGIIEYKFQGKYKYELVHIGEFLTSIIVSTLISIVILIVYSFMSDSYSVISVLYSLMLLPITLIGMYGLGLVIGSFTIIDKKTGSYILLIQIAMAMIVNSSLIYKYKFLDFLPTSAAIKAARLLYFGESIELQSLLFILVVNIGWLVIGLLLFRTAVFNSKAKGTLPIH